MNLGDLMRIGQEAAQTFGGGKQGGIVGMAGKMTEAYSAYREIMSAPNKIAAAMAFAKQKTGKSPDEIAALARNMTGKQREFADRYFPGGLDGIARLGGGKETPPVFGSPPPPQGMPADIAALLDKAKKK